MQLANAEVWKRCGGFPGLRIRTCGTRPSLLELGLGTSLIRRMNQMLEREMEDLIASLRFEYFRNRFRASIFDRKCGILRAQDRPLW